jgi:16S rRNA (adenine1518-N6/adenine1519-N6)-dimethyltransferase
MNSFRPKKHLGQNFMTDPLAVQTVIRAADLNSDDVVLEVGPGTGLLTRELLKTAKQVIAIEKDKNLVERLADEFKSEKKLEVIESDILKFDFEKYFHPLSSPKLGGEPASLARRGERRGMKQSYKVVANIPYYLTSHLIQKFLYALHKPTSIILTIQKEVGERIVAQAGKMSLLSLSVQLVADARIEAHISKTSFTPVPQVDSVVIKIIPNDKYPNVEDKKLFFRITKACFIGKRKQIHNTLKHNLHLSGEQVDRLLSQCKIDSQARPQELSMEDWIRLYQTIKDIN